MTSCISQNSSAIQHLRHYDTLVPEDLGEPALQGHPASAPPSERREEPRADRQTGRVWLLDEEELLNQLFAHLGGIPLEGREKPMGATPLESCYSLS